MTRKFYVLAASLAIVACNALTDIDSDYPPPSGDEQETENNANNINNTNNTNNLNNTSAGDDCSRVTAESYPTVTIQDGACFRLGNEVDACTQLYQECRAEEMQPPDPSEPITCEEAQVLFEDYADVTDVPPEDLTDEELLNACIEFGDVIDERLTDEECQRLIVECDTLF